jgi:hypothetical protein
MVMITRQRLRSSGMLQYVRYVDTSIVKATQSFKMQRTTHPTTVSISAIPRREPQTSHGYRTFPRTRMYPALPIILCDV